MKNKSFIKKLLVLLVVLITSIPQMWAYDLTFRCIPKQIWGNNWTEGSSKVKINAQDENGTWRYIVMTDEGNTYNGYKIYKGKLTDFSSDKAHNIQFQRLNSSSEWQAQLEWGDYQKGSFICSQIRTSSGWTAYKIDHSIAASSTVVWDMAGNDKSWAASYLYRDVNGSSGGNDEMTRIGTTTQWYKTYASASTKIASFQFRANNSNWNDYTHTTNIEKNVSGVTLYTYDNTNNGGSPKQLNWHETTSAKKATSGTKIYLDKTDATDWGEVWLKYGTQWFNRSSAAAATLVTGTDALYVITMPNDAYYEKYVLADNYGYTNYNNITNDGNLKHRIAHQASNLSSDITYIPTSTASGKGTSGNPYVWYYSTLSGHTRTLTISAPSNGSISATYTDESGTEQTVTSGSFDVAQTCKVTITATPNDGYALSALTLDDASITSGAEQIIRADGTIAATFVAETTYSITVSHKCGSRTFDTEVLSVGVTTPRNISSQTIDGFSFSSWSDLTNVTNKTGNLTTDPISIVSTAAGSMTCNYTQWPCSLDVNTTSGNTGYTSREAMTYDATAKAYYKEFTTTAATQYFRFYINSKKYAPSSNTEVVISGTKVAAATDVTDYASSMPSVYFNDGGTGSKIRVWFDYENREAWVEEVKYTVTVSAGDNGEVDPTSVSVGNVVASSTISATADDNYHWSSWDVPSGVTIVSGSETKDITIKATAAGTLTANFAGDQYTITYRDKGDVEFSGSQTTPPTTHTYGTATTLKIPTKTGYDFGGWFTASDCASGAVGTSSAASLGATAFTGNITLYAKWTAKSYSTSNNIKNADGSNAGTYTATYDATSIALNSTPSKTGYNINNYYIESTFTTLIANTNRSLTSATTTYTSGGKWKYTSAPNLYVKWQAKTYTVTLDDNGDYTSNGTATATYDSNTLTSITAPQRTGYSPEGYYTNAACTTKVATPAGALQASTDHTTDGSLWKTDDDATLYTKWTANTWYVKFNANGGSGSMDNESFTYDASAKALTSNAFTKTGYHFNGWNTEAGGGGTSYTDGQSVSNLTSTKDGIVDLYAQWAANTYSVVFNANGGSGSMSNEAFTYDASAKALTTNTFYKDGYHFDGWATAADGDVVYTDGQSVSNLTNTNSGTFNLYAHWTKSVLTDITFAPTSAAGQVRVTATPVITPAPTGTTQICWTMWSNSACTEKVDTASFTQVGETNAVTFWTPDLSGTYYIRAEFKTGSSCGGGTELNTIVRTYVVASEHNVTIKYMYDGMEIASRTQEVIPAADSIEITAPDLDGYTFSSWSLGDVILQAGAAPKPALTSSTIKIKALYDGVVTANYSKKDMIYFNNTLGWEHVYVYFYSSDKYWDGTKGTGFQRDYYFKYKDGEEEKSTAPAYQTFWGPMERIEGTNIWRFDYQAAAEEIYPGGWSEINGYTNVAFTKDPQGYGHGAYGKGYDFFYDTEVVRRGDFDHGMSMFVPIKDAGDSKNNSMYYSNGYWMNYPESTGYTLLVYYTSDKDKDKTPIRTVPFGFNENTKLPSAVTVDLEASRDYYFEVKTHHVSAKYYGNNASMTTTSNSNWKFETGKNRCGMRTTAAGNYTFNWSYFYSESAYDYRMTVDYPATTGDYRIKYTDTEHTGVGTSYARYSRVINKRENGVDTVSFFIATNKEPVFAIENITGINASTGAITWNPVAGKSVTTTAVNGSKVYNIRIEQDADGNITSAAVIGAYTGNYYIRTDCASSQWNNYRYDPGNLMTYSEYAATGSDYTHYFMAHANAGTNVKFVVANDYSAYLTDTLYQSSYRGGDADHVTSSGSLNAEANIRFMWNMRDNKVIRAYLAAAKSDGSKFLVLQGTSGNIMDEKGTVLSDANANNHGAGDDAIQFVDKENWMYETTVQVVPSSYVKLYAVYNSSTFYFYGSDGDFDESHAIQLVTGSGSAQTVKVVYDFKTDRLVAAWQPPVGAISTSTAINADVMLVRNHQEAGQNIRFTNSGALTAVKTVYGVMQFNRWILNNRDGEDDVDPDHCSSAALIAEYHPLLPANQMKSDYERFNYFISFPFDVKVGDIFGFGTYGRHWVLKYYDGKSRAANGYWADSESNWKYITNTDSVLHAYQGYLLKLSVSRMAYDNEEVWSNNSSIMELYFPSTSAIGSITQKNETIPALGAEYECTINRGTGTDGDRRVKDSYWRCIGVPSFADYSATLSDGSGTITWTTGATLPYLYEWIMETNKLQAQSTSTYSFEAMKAYLVQYAGQIIFSNVSAKNSVVARHRDASEITNAEWKLTLSQDDKVVDQAFVRLTDNENVTANFDFDQDLSKELNTGANIYTMIGYERAAANCLPLTEQTTVIPVGVVAATDGDYTISIPEGTNGVGVTLIDNETGIRTPLSALDYTVSLTAGTYNDRFVLEISPIQQMPTNIDNVQGESAQSAKARKVMIDGILYIVKDGKVFDAQGKRLQ